MAARFWKRLRLIHLGCADPGSPLSMLANTQGAHLLGICALQAMLARMNKKRSRSESPRAAWRTMLRIGRDQGLIML